MSEPKKAKLKDARAVRSREALRSALLTLIEQKSFEQISIRDITAAAGVSYPVFFRQYSSKEDLLGEIAIDEIKALLAIPVSDFRSSLAICQLVQSHRMLWKALLTAGAASIMRAEFIRLAKEISETRERMNPWLPVDLTSSVVVGAMFEILAWWLAQAEDYPIEHVARIIQVLAIEPALQPKPLHLSE